MKDFRFYRSMLNELIEFLGDIVIIMAFISIICGISVLSIGIILHALN